MLMIYGDVEDAVPYGAGAATWGWQSSDDGRGWTPAPTRGVGGTPWGRRWTKERVVEDADPYGGRETDRVPPDLLRYYPTPLRGRH